MYLFFGVVISLITTLSLSTVIVNAESIDVILSHVLVPIDKNNSVKLLINDIEFDLNENDTDVVTELTNFKAKCEDLLITNIENSENLEN